MVQGWPTADEATTTPPTLDPFQQSLAVTRNPFGSWTAPRTEEKDCLGEFVVVRNLVVVVVVRRRSSSWTWSLTQRLPTTNE